MNQAIIRERLQALGLPETIDADKYPNLLAMYADIIAKYKNRPAYTSLGRTLSYIDLDNYANAIAAYLQHQTNLKVGDRVAVQLPNIVQHPAIVLGILRAGMVVVNTNPLYTERELEHQLNDAGARALFVLANVAHTAASIIKQTQVTTVIVTELADFHPAPKRQILNFAIKYIKRMVPAYDLPNAIPLTKVVSAGWGVIVRSPDIQPNDIAVLQYTGGTTGVAKGAMLTHRNIIANTLQSAEIFDTYGLDDKGECLIQPLPLYHIFAVIVSYIMMMKGGHTILIPNPRDQKALIKELGQWKFQGFCGLNTLFVALVNNPEFRKVNFSDLKMTLSGGMALTRFAAEEWKKVTGCDVYEGYGLTETSPVVSVNSGNGNRLGTIGVPVPSTEIDIRDDEGKSLQVTEAGELWVKGPQVMKGYWNREEDTAKTIHDGWLATGDVAVLSEDGYLKIVDRKKELIIVSGFNVYPSEVEDVVTLHPAVLEAVAIGLKDDAIGEVVCVYVVKVSGASVTADDIIKHCRESLTAYKVPKIIVFTDELPKSNVGKVLRRKVREIAEEQGVTSAQYHHHH